MEEERDGQISDKTDYSRFARPTDEDEGIWLDHVEVHRVTHPVGQVKEMHVHDPHQDHVIVIRSGRMRWTVEDQTLDPEPGHVIVTPAGTAHSYEVLGDEPARVVRVDSPVRRQTES
jgi:quercetin dioxygenase-like cupin family protein